MPYYSKTVKSPLFNSLTPGQLLSTIWSEFIRWIPCCNESLKPMKSLPKICKINMDILAYWGSHTKQVWCIAIWCVSHGEIINYWHWQTNQYCIHQHLQISYTWKCCCWRTWLEKVIKYMKFQNSPDFLQVTVECACTCVTNQLEESIFVMINLLPLGMVLVHSVGIFSLQFLVLLWIVLN